MPYDAAHFLGDTEEDPDAHGAPTLGGCIAGFLWLVVYAMALAAGVAGADTLMHWR